MNSYVLVYERSTGALQHEEFGPGRRAEALARRLVLDRQVGPGTEVVVLDGESLEDLRTTHRRYFEDVHQLLARLSGPLAARTAPPPDAPSGRAGGFPGGVVVVEGTSHPARWQAPGPRRV